MSKRKNGTLRAGKKLGLNPYGWGNGGTRKRPRELQLHIGQTNNISHPYYTGNTGGNQDEKTVEAKN